MAPQLKALHRVDDFKHYCLTGDNTVFPRERAILLHKANPTASSAPWLTCVALLSSSTASKAMVENTQVLPVPDLACTMRSGMNRHRGHRKPQGTPGPSPGPPAHPSRSAPAGWPSAGPVTAYGTQPPPAPPAQAPIAAATRSRRGRRAPGHLAFGTGPQPPPASPRSPPSCER